MPSPREAPRDPAPRFSWGRSYRQAPACMKPTTDPGRSARAAVLPDKGREPSHPSAQTQAPESTADSACARSPAAHFSSLLKEWRPTHKREMKCRTSNKGRTRKGHFHRRLNQHQSAHQNPVYSGLWAKKVPCLNMSPRAGPSKGSVVYIILLTWSGNVQPRSQVRRDPAQCPLWGPRQKQP